MILLDTNVLSELMRPSPEPKVLQWLDSHPAMDVWISAVTVAEIRLGVALLPDSKRRALLSDLAERMFREDFSERCLPFDFSAAGEYASIVATRTRLGIRWKDTVPAGVLICRGRASVTAYTMAGICSISPW